MKYAIKVVKRDGQQGYVRMADGVTYYMSSDPTTFTLKEANAFLRGNKSNFRFLKALPEIVEWNEVAITTAPKYVIDELDRWAGDENNEFCIGSLLDDISAANWNFISDVGFSREAAQWVYRNHRPASEDLLYEYAVIEHVFGDTRLEAEDGK